MANSQNSITNERRASFTLACVISKSKNKQCIEAAVRAILYHSNKSSASLVVQAAKRFSEVFDDLPSPDDQKRIKETSTEYKQFAATGYGRILALLALRCSEYENLAKAFRQELYPSDVRDTLRVVCLEYERCVRFL